MATVPCVLLLYGFGGAVYSIAVLVFLSAVLRAMPDRSTQTQPDAKPPP
jgi:hypothetical protein